jgi:hypothetical protein
MSRRVSAVITLVALACAGCRSGGAAVPPAGGAASAPSAAAAANHPPAVRARCEPCTVPPGGAATVRAEASDADRDTLTYAWSAAAGTLSSAAAPQSPWTAPATPGPVPITVRVTDGNGGMASDVITITVR